MTRATYKQFPPTDLLRPAAAPQPINDRTLRWTPGPDELRLPSCDDEPVPKTTRHVVARIEGFGGLRVRWHGRLDVFVGSDQFVYWDRAYDPETESGNPPLSPDVYVAFGVANRHRESYVVWEEGKPPDFVLEIALLSSRQRDEAEKRDAYAKMGVPECFLYDPEGRLKPQLSGFELCEGEYRQLPEETFAEGVVGVRSKVLGLCLCLREPPTPMDVDLGWYDPATSEFMPTRCEAEDKAEAEAAAEEEAVAAEARMKAAKAEAEASEARAKASDARADASRAEAEEAKAEAEASKAEAEASEAKVAELEALIEKMRRG